MVVSSIMEIWSLAIMPILLIIGLFIVRYYLSASRDLTRMESIARSPVLNTLNEVLPGTMIIRSCKYETKYVDKFNKKMVTLYRWKQQQVWNQYGFCSINFYDLSNGFYSLLRRQLYSSEYWYLINICFKLTNFLVLFTKHVW